MFRIYLKIHGRVQGAGFRWSTQRKAKNLGLIGYVKNLPDGTVEVVAEGREDDLKKLLEYCKIGPLLASVQKVDETWQEVDVVQFTDFRINF